MAVHAREQVVDGDRRTRVLDVAATAAGRTVVDERYEVVHHGVVERCVEVPEEPRRALDLARRFHPQFRDKNRRDIGKSQSVWTDFKMETARSQHALRRATPCTGRWWGSSR